MDSGQQNVTEYEVLREVVTQLQTLSDLTTANCYIIAEPVFMGMNVPGDLYVQVSPGLSVDKDSKAGRGRRELDIRVAVFRRLLSDQANQDTERIVSASKGVLELMERIQNKLTQNFLKGKLVVPLHPIRRETGLGLPAQISGWTRQDRLFQCTHREVFSAPQAAVS